MSLPLVVFRKVWKAEHEILGEVSFTARGKTSKEAMRNLKQMIKLSEEHDKKSLETSKTKSKRI